MNGTSIANWLQNSFKITCTDHRIIEILGLRPSNRLSVSYYLMTLDLFICIAPPFNNKSFIIHFITVDFFFIYLFIYKKKNYIHFVMLIEVIYLFFSILKVLA